VKIKKKKKKPYEIPVQDKSNFETLPVRMCNWHRLLLPFPLLIPLVRFMTKKHTHIVILDSKISDLKMIRKLCVIISKFKASNILPLHHNKKQ